MQYSNHDMILKQHTTAKRSRLAWLCVVMGLCAALPLLSACVSLPKGDGILNSITIGSEPFLALERDFYQLAYQVVINQGNRYTNIETTIDSYTRFYDRIASAGILDPMSVEYLYFDTLINKEIMLATARSDPEQTERYYQAALKSARMAARQNSNFSNVYSLLASILYQPFNPTIGSSGLLTTTLTGKILSQAMSTDALNPGAWEVQGLRYLYLPIGFGGNRDLAIDAFERQAQHPHPYHKLLGRLWLSLAYYVEERQEEAVSTLALLRREAPNSPFVTEFADAIESGRRPF